MRALSLCLDVLERIAIALAVVLIALMALLMNVEVISRYVFRFSTQIADEYAGYFFTAVTLLCFVPAMRRGRFIRVTAVLDRLPGKLRIALDIVGSLLGAAVSVVFAWTTFQLAWGSWQIGSTALQAIQTPLFIPQSVMPLGFALLAIAFIERVMLLLAGNAKAMQQDSPELTHGLD